MALTAQQKTDILALVAQEGGLRNLTEQIKAVYQADGNTVALNTLSPVTGFPVSDWTVVEAYLASAKPNLTVSSVMDAIAAAITAHQNNKMAPLLLALYCATKTQLGRP